MKSVNSNIERAEELLQQAREELDRSSDESRACCIEIVTMYEELLRKYKNKKRFKIHVIF